MLLTPENGCQSGAVTTAVYNQLDCLRVRWQTVPLTEAQNISSRGILHFASHIIKTEGLIQGLWKPGITANAIAMGSSSALRFGFYEGVRDALHFSSLASQQGDHHEKQTQKKGIHMFIAAFSCGAVAYFVTSPLHIIKTKIQAGRNKMDRNITQQGTAPGRTGLLENLRIIFNKEGFTGLWRGSSPVAARGALLTAGQLCSYDGFKTLCKSNEFIEDGTTLHVLSSIVATFAITIFSTPADLVLSRFVSSYSSRTETVMDCIKVIYNESGILGFWRGSGICFVRVLPVTLTYSIIYEQLRYNFGLGYMS